MFTFEFGSIGVSLRIFRTLPRNLLKPKRTDLVTAHVAVRIAHAATEPVTGKVAALKSTFPFALPTAVALHVAEQRFGVRVAQEVVEADPTLACKSGCDVRQSVVLNEPPVAAAVMLANHFRARIFNVQWRFGLLSRGMSSVITLARRW